MTAAELRAQRLRDAVGADRSSRVGADEQIELTQALLDRAHRYRNLTLPTAKMLRDILLEQA